MKPEDVKELHYITPIENLPSILENGILSHKLAGKIPHLSVALDATRTGGRKRSSPVEGPYTTMSTFTSMHEIPCCTDALISMPSSASSALSRQ